MKVRWPVIKMNWSVSVESLAHGKYDVSVSIKAADQWKDWHCHLARVVCAAKHCTFQPGSARCKLRHRHILQLIKTRPRSENTGLCQDAHFSKQKQSWGVLRLHVDWCYGPLCKTAVQSTALGRQSVRCCRLMLSSHAMQTGCVSR